MKSIKTMWHDGWSIRNIALKHGVSIPYACQELGFGVRGLK
jgi:ferredoxin